MISLFLTFSDPAGERRMQADDLAAVGQLVARLHGVGVRGVQMFDGGMGTPLVVPEKLSFGSARWQEALHLAKVTARRLGLEFAVATSPGWSAAGAPWVRPEDAMKKVVWSQE